MAGFSQNDVGDLNEYKRKCPKACETLVYSTVLAVVFPISTWKHGEVTYIDHFQVAAAFFSEETKMEIGR